MAKASKTSTVTSNHERKSPLGRLNKLMLFTVAILIIFEALVTNAKASNGSKLAELQAEYETLNSDVSSLELEVASYASLTYIKHNATEDLGMKTVEKNVLYLPLEETSKP
jgi:cell division protein FtsL